MPMTASASITECAPYGGYEEETPAPLQGVCKDCGNGTLNNAHYIAFAESNEGMVCRNCHSTHIDLL